MLESINDNYYGFNLKNKLERKTAKEIVLGNWMVNADVYVIGWKVAKDLSSWVNNAVAWEGFVIDIEDHAAGSGRHWIGGKRGEIIVGNQHIAQWEMRTFLVIGEAEKIFLH